jgi:hypothetical protein
VTLKTALNTLSLLLGLTVLLAMSLLVGGGSLRRWARRRRGGRNHTPAVTALAVRLWVARMVCVMRSRHQELSPRQGTTWMERPRYVEDV